LPDTANLGAASLMLTLNGESGLEGTSTWHQFQIEEYRRPEFEVTTRPESDEPFVSTQPATIAATGEYYAGGPLANAPANWSVSTTPTTYAPPGWAEFTFGIWIPWWFGEFGGYDDGYYGEGGYYGDVAPCCGPIDDTTVKQYTGVTDGTAPTTCSWASRPPTACCPTCRWQSRPRPPSPM
jgi:hypothetical protein